MAKINRALFIIFSPTFLLIGTVIILILNYENTYLIEEEEYRKIWISVRNLFNVFMLALVIFVNFQKFIKSIFKKIKTPYLHFNLCWIFGLVLMNFSIIFIEIIKVSIDALPVELGFEIIKK